MRSYKIITALLCMATLTVAMSFTGKPPENANIAVTFHSYVGDKPLQLDTAVYKNGMGQSYTISKLRYYVGHIALHTAGGGIIAYDNIYNYYLIDAEDGPAKKIELGHIPPGAYTSIEFIIGVDSTDNCSGAQSGALDPVNAMFWAWNTGYIFLKLEGNAAVSASPGHIFEYHIGGYRPPYNCIRHVNLTFDKPMQIDASGSNEVHIKADAGKILDGSTAIDIAKLSSVTDFHNAAMVADNYMHMFSILYLSYRQ